MIVTLLITLPLLLLLISSRVIADETKRLSSQEAKIPVSMCSHMQGYVVEEDGDFKVTTALCNGHYEAWLSKQKPISSAEDASYSDAVIDHMHIRDLRIGEIFSSGPYCIAAGKEVRWLAIYNWGKKKSISGKNGRVREAWVVNLITEKFERAPKKLVRSVLCTANQDE